MDSPVHVGATMPTGECSTRGLPRCRHVCPGQSSLGTPGLVSRLPGSLHNSVHWSATVMYACDCNARSTQTQEDWETRNTCLRV